MNRLTFIAFVILIVAIGGSTVWYLTHSRSSALEQSKTQEDSSQNIYANGTHGFTISYPENAEVDYDFSPDYHLASTWRANALANATGTPIVSFVPYSMQSDHSYPRYFTAMVRIGASSDPQELANCLVPTPDQGETAIADRDINGTTWKAFSFENAGMMQYASGVSYRTIHEGKCIALEKVRTGSSYREDSASAEDIADNVLDAEYSRLDAVIETFTFVR